MKDWIHLPVAALVAGLIGFGGALFSAPERGVRGAAPALGELRAEIDALRGEQARLGERLAQLPAPAPAPASRAPVVDLDAAIADFMARRLTADTVAPAASDGDVDPEVGAIVDRILSGDVSGRELQDLWEKLRKEKRIDAVLAEIERQAELSPNNPDLQNELGKACLQKLFDVGIGPMAATWGQKADQAFDRALELDDSHWEARFQKALALSNWPSFLGKQAESVHQFEILMERQENGAQRPEFARTYFFLGNLYDQKGDHAKALATWRRGAQRFPDDATLRAKLEERP